MQMIYPSGGSKGGGRGRNGRGSPSPIDGAKKKREGKKEEEKKRKEKEERSRVHEKGRKTMKWHLVTVTTKTGKTWGRGWGPGVCASEMRAHGGGGGGGGGGLTDHILIFRLCKTESEFSLFSKKL